MCIIYMITLMFFTKNLFETYLLMTLNVHIIKHKVMFPPSPTLYFISNRINDFSSHYFN